MMAFSKIFLRKYTRMNTKINSRLLDKIMNIDLLMIWLLKQSKVKEVSFGLVRIMMVMFNLILSHKASVPLDS